MKAHSFSRIRLYTQDVARCLLGNSRWGWGGFQHSLILNTNLKEYQLTCRNGLEHLKIVENPGKCLESGLIITMPQEETVFWVMPMFSLKNKISATCQVLLNSQRNCGFRLFTISRNFIKSIQKLQGGVQARRHAISWCFWQSTSLRQAQGSPALPGSLALQLCAWTSWVSPAEAAGRYKEDTSAVLADVHFLFHPSCFSFSPFSQAIGPADAVKKQPTPAFYTFFLPVALSLTFS